MAVYDYGLNLELKNFQAFVDGAKEVDKVLNNVASVIGTTAAAFDKIDSGVLKEKAKAITAIAKSYESLGARITKVNASAIIDVNKAISSGAQVKTIEGKAEAMAAFAKEAQKLSKLPDLGQSAQQIATILTAFAGVGGSLSNFKDVDQISAAINSLVSAFKKLDKVAISPDLITAIQNITTTLADVVAQSKNTGSIFALVKTLELLFKALRSIGTGADVAKIPEVLQAMTTAVSTLTSTLQNLNKNSYFAGDKIISQIREIGAAFRDLGIAIRSYGGVKGSGFDTIGANIDKTIAAFNKLIAAFKDTTLGADIDKSVKPAAEAINALGAAFESLGRKKGFDNFPNTIQNINTAMTQLNTSSLDALVAKINAALPTLRDLAELAKAVTIVNSQAGKAFAQAARDKEVDNKSTFNLVTAYQGLRAVIQGVIPVISTVINVITNVTRFIVGLIGPTSQLAVVLLKLPFNFVVAGFKTLVSVITAPFNLLKSAGEQTLKFAHDLHLVEIGLNAIIAPFKLVYAVIVSVINIVANVSAAFTKLFGIFQIFSGIGNTISAAFNAVGSAFNTVISGVEKIGSAFAKSTTQAAQASSAVEQTSETIKQSGVSATTTATKVENYSQAVDKTGKTASNASTGFGNFGQAVTSSSSGVEQAIEKLGRLQVTLVAVQRFTETAKEVIGEIGSRLIDAGTSAFDAAAKFEQLQISLNILAGREFNNLNPGQFDSVLDAVPQVREQVDALIERFELLAITSPFTSEQISSGFQLAQIYGFTSQEAENLTNVLVDANAAIGASGENISSIILPLGQIKQLGKATLVDLKQLSTAARIPIFDLLAKELTEVTGKATKVSDVMSLISEGMIDSDFAINTVVKSLRKDFSGAAAASTTSLEGLRSTLADFRANTLRRFSTPIIKAILFGNEEGDFGLASFLSVENITKKLDEAQQAGENLAITVNRVFQTIVKFAQLGQAALSLIPEPIKVIAKNLALLIGVAFAANLAFGVLVEGLFVSITVMGLFINTNTIIIGSVIGLATVIVTNYDAIKQAIVNVGDSLTQIPAFVSAVGQAFANLFTNTESSKNSFSGFNTLLQSFGNGLISVVTTVVRFAQAFGTAFNQLMTTGKASILVFADLPGVLSTVGAEIFKVLNVFATWGSQIANFPVTIGNVASTVSEIFSGLLGEFVTWGSNIIVAFSEGINNTIGLLGDAIQGIGTMLAFWLSPGSPPKVAPELDKWGELAALEFVKGFADAFVSGLDAAGELIQNNFSTVIGAIGNGILAPFAAIGRVAVVLVGGTLANALAAVVTVGNGIFEVVSAIAKGIGNQFGIVIITIINVVEALAKPTKAFVTLQNVVQAFADGAKMSLENFGNTVKGVFSGLLSILGGVIAFINGEFLVGFIALGQVSDNIKNQLGEIGKGSRDFLTGIQSALQGAEDYFATTLDNVVDYGSNIVQQFANGMLDAVSAVAQALQAIGEEITYWLAPGSPPKLLPDIDQWGTDAANEFVGAFTKADLSVIGDFGNTIEDLLTSLDISGVDTEKIVEQFAGGLIQSQQSGSFGADTFQNIAELAGEAAPDVVSLAQKYAQLASEQSRLNEVTNQYNKELESVQGTLDTINTNEGIELNTKKVESLTNALNNQLLTQAERTRIQKQIEKLQAETRIKELEAEKNALERNSNSTEEAIDLQKQQLQLAQQFDKKNTTVAGDTSASSAAKGTDKTAKAQERLNDAILKYKLQATDTAGKIKIMKEELSKVTEGSQEYYEILTEISRLEEQLANERERESKKGKKDGLVDQIGGALGQGGGLTSLQEAQAKITETIQTTKDNITNLQKTVKDKFDLIRNHVQNAWTIVRGYLDSWVLQNDTVKASIVAIGVVLAGVKIVSGIQSIGAALALLSNPVVAISAGVIGLTAALAFFAVKAGGIQGIIDSLREKFDLFKTGFSLGTSGFAYELDFSSLDSAIVTIASNIGAGGAKIGTAIVTLFSNLGSYIQTGLGVLGGLFVTGWNTFQTNVIETMSNFGILNTQLGQIALNIVGALFTYFITPMSTAFNDNETLLGGITSAFIAFYDGVVQLAVDLTVKLQEFLGAQNNGQIIEDFFSNTFIGQSLEANINEAVGNIIPSLKGSFDLSEFVVYVVDNLRNLYNTIITTATQLKDAIVTPIVDTFNTIRDTLSGVIEQNQSAFSEFFSEVASPEFIAALSTIAEVLGKVALAIITVAAAIVDAALIGILRNVGDLVIELGDGFGILKDAIAKFAAGDILGGIITTFQGLAKVFDAVFGNIADAIADAVKALLEFIGIDTSGTLGVIIQFVADLVVQIFAFNKVFTIFGALWRGLIAVINGAEAIFVAIIGLFAGGASSTSLWSRLLGSFFDIIGKVVAKLTSFPGAFFAVGNALINLPQEIQNALTGLLDIVGGALSGLVTSAATGIYNFGAALIKGIYDLDNSIRTSLYEFGIKILTNIVNGLLGNILPSFSKIKSGLILGLALIDLSSSAAAFRSVIEGIFGFDSEKIVTSLTEKAKSAVTSAFTNIKDVAFNVADAIVISEEEKQKLADKIQGVLPNFDSIFGEGSTKKTALAISDFITVDEGEINTVKQMFQDLLDVLGKFSKILGIPQAFTTSIQAIKDLISGETTFSQALGTVATALGTIVTNLNTAVGNPFTVIAETIGNLSTPITTVSEGFTNLYNAITSLLTIDLSGFASVFSPITDTFNGIQEKIDGLIGGIQSLNIIPGLNIGSAQVSGGDEVKNKIQSTLNNQTLDITQKLDIITDDQNLSEQSKKLLDAFTASYKENTGFTGISDFAEINKDLIEKGFTAADITALATSFGIEVPAGLAEGMADTDGTLSRESRGLATNLLYEISDELGIKSPSTKARDDIGIPFVAGIAVGLQDYSAVTTNLKTIVDSMFTTVKESLIANSTQINIAQSLFTLDINTVAITKNALTTILDLHNNTFDEISKQSIPNFIDSVEEQFISIFDEIIELAEQFVEDFVDEVETLDTRVTAALDNLIKKIRDKIPAFKAVGKDLGKALMEGIVSGIEDQTSSVIGAINNLFGTEGVQATEIFDTAKTAGTKIGSEFTKGVAEGVVAPAALQAVKEAVIQMINEAQTAAEQAAGIESPSKLFRDAIGRNITAGVSLGIIDGVDELIDSAKGLMNVIYIQARDGLGFEFVSGISQGISDGQVMLNNSVISLLNGSVVSAKNALQIHSPSKVTREGIGSPYVDGIITALETGRGKLSNVAGSLLDVLPSGKSFNYDIQLQKQPVELQYSNLLTALPQLTQSVALMRNGNLANSPLRLAASKYVSAYDNMRYTNSQSISTMTDTSRTVVSNNNVYNYAMHVTTTPDRVERVAHNFEAMRMRRRI